MNRHILIKDLQIFWQHPRLLCKKLALITYKAFTVSRQVTQRMGHYHGLSPDTSIDVATPFHVIAKIYDYLGNRLQNHTFVDLGCGYGELLWYANLVKKVPAIGVEANPAIASVARRMAKNESQIAIFTQKIPPPRPWGTPPQRGIKNQYSKGGSPLTNNPLLAKGEQGVYYLSWTCFSDTDRYTIRTWLRQTLQPGDIIATSTHPIMDSQFLLLHRFQTWFSWGEGTVYISQRV